jgi:hypothetical protein
MIDIDFSSDEIDVAAYDTHHAYKPEKNVAEIQGPASTASVVVNNYQLLKKTERQLQELLGVPCTLKVNSAINLSIEGPWTFSDSKSVAKARGLLEAASIKVETSCSRITGLISFTFPLIWNKEGVLKSETLTSLAEKLNAFLSEKETSEAFLSLFTN